MGNKSHIRGEHIFKPSRTQFQRQWKNHDFKTIKIPNQVKQKIRKLRTIHNFQRNKSWNQMEQNFTALDEYKFRASGTKSNHMRNRKHD